MPNWDTPRSASTQPAHIWCKGISDRSNGSVALRLLVMVLSSLGDCSHDAGVTANGCIVSSSTSSVRAIGCLLGTTRRDGRTRVGVPQATSSQTWTSMSDKSRSSVRAPVKSDAPSCWACGAESAGPTDENRRRSRSAPGGDDERMTR